MLLSDTEEKILLKIWDICYLSLYDEIALRHLYNITSKRYLWITLKSLESKNIIHSHREGRIKMVQLTSNGVRLVKALHLIDTL